MCNCSRFEDLLDCTVGITDELGWCGWCGERVAAWFQGVMDIEGSEWEDINLREILCEGVFYNQEFVEVECSDSRRGFRKMEWAV